MITITRNGLKLTSDADVIPAQGSSNVPVSFVNDDDEYASYIVQPSIGWFTKSGAFKVTLAVFENNSFDIPAEAFLQDGQIYISIGLVDPQNANHIEKTLQLSLRCLPAPFGTVVLPDTDTWQKFVQSFTDDLFDSYTAEEVAPVLEQAQQAVQTANSASSNANQAVQTANQASQTAQEASASVRVIYSGTSTPASSLGEDDDYYIVTGDGEGAGNFYQKISGSWVLQMSLVGPQGIQGSTGPTEIKIDDETQQTLNMSTTRDTSASTQKVRVQLKGSDGKIYYLEVDPDSIYLSNGKKLVTGIGFYISDDDESVTIGTYEEWVAAGCPAFPSE